MEAGAEPCRVRPSDLWEGWDVEAVGGLSECADASVHEGRLGITAAADRSHSKQRSEEGATTAKALQMHTHTTMLTL